MAIVKTTFASGSSNISQVASWLQANATDYFDEISLSGTTITCTKDGHTAFAMTSTSSSRYRIYTANANYVTFRGDDVLFGISTSKGLFMRSVGLDNPSYYSYTDVFISKTDSGGLSFVVYGIDAGTQNNNARFYATDFNAPSIDFWVDSNGASGSYYIPKYLTRLDANKTSIANVVCKNTDSYTPDVYQMVYSQYSYDTTGVITLDGKQYFTNGCLARAD